MDQFEDIKLLEVKLGKSTLPPELTAKAKTLVERLTRLSGTALSQEYDSVSRYLDWITALPWQTQSSQNSSLEAAKKILDSTHYGLENLKERILEYIAVTDLQKTPSHAPSILLLGLVGTGKTTIAITIAKALGRKFGRIPMGGMGDALQLRGRSRSYLDAEPGQIIKVLRRTQEKNPIILLDEIDRVTSEAKADIMGVLVELLDPEQNNKFLDHFIDYPFDLSQVFFIATANNTKDVATAVLDRLEVIEMPSYNDQQKITIAKNYLLPRAIASSGLDPQDLTIAEEVWEQITRPLGFDAGLRTLDRTISGICRKVAKLKVEGQLTKVNIKSENLKAYLPTW